MPKINLNSLAVFTPPLRSLRLIYIHTLLATAFGLNAATSEAGLAANGMENALAGQAAITPDGNAPKAYLNIYSWIKISTRTVIMIWASSVYHQEP